MVKEKENSSYVRRGTFIGGYIDESVAEKVKEVQDRLAKASSRTVGFAVEVNTTKALQYIIEKFNIDDFLPIDPKVASHESLASLN